MASAAALRGLLVGAVAVGDLAADKHRLHAGGRAIPACHAADIREVEAVTGVALAADKLALPAGALFRLLDLHRLGLRRLLVDDARHDELWSEIIFRLVII